MTEQSIPHGLNLRFQQEIRSWLSPTEFVDSVNKLLSSRQFRLRSDTINDITWVNTKSGHQLRLDRYTRIEAVIWERQIDYASPDDLLSIFMDEYEAFMSIIDELAHQLPYPFAAAIPQLQVGLWGNRIQDVKTSLLARIASCHSRRNSGVNIEVDIVEDTPQSFDCLLIPVSMEE